MVLPSSSSPAVAAASKVAKKSVVAAKNATIASTSSSSSSSSSSATATASKTGPTTLVAVALVSSDSTNSNAHMHSSNNPGTSGDGDGGGGGGGSSSDGTTTTTTTTSVDTTATPTTSYAKAGRWKIDEFAAGAAAGVTGTILGFPLDVLKCRLQTTSGKGSAVESFRRMAKTEGIRGLFKGVAAPLVSLTVVNTIGFSTYGQMRRLIEERNRVHGRPSALTPIQYGYSGLGVGFVVGAFSTPFEMVKVRTQMDNISGKRFNGSTGCISYLVKRHGITSLYTGLGINCSKEMVFYFVYFGIYQNMKDLLKQSFPSVPFPLAVAGSGALSGMCAWLSCFPLDVIKSRIQANKALKLTNGPLGVQPLVPGHGQSSLAIARTVLRSHGVRGFYKGAGTCAVRALLVSSTRFSAYEMTLKLFEKID